MEIPLLGWLVLPLAAACLFLPVRWMLLLAIFLAPFKASSVVNFSLGGTPTGLQAGNFGTVVFLGKLALDAGVRGRFAWSPALARNVLPLGAFVGIAVASALVLTWVFSGSVEVYPTSTGLREEDVRRLSFNAGHFTQTTYLVVNALFAVAMANVLVTRRLQFFAAGGYALTTAFVIAMGLYQLTAHYLGVPYPYDVINNNPGYRQNYYQTLLDLKRFSSVLTEPSAAAHWLAGFVPFAFVTYLRGFYGTWMLLLGVAALACIVIATSTTGYVVLALFAAWAAWRGLIWGSAAGGVSRRGWRAFTAVAALVLAGCVALWYSGLLELASTVLDRALIEKLGSESAARRLGSDLHAVGITVHTFGLGAGWGSNRTSSQLLHVLSNVGLPGLLVLAWFAVRLYSRHRHFRPRGGPPRRLEDLASASGWAVVGMVLAALVAAGDPNALGFWVGLALYLGALSGAEAEARTLQPLQTREAR